MYVSKIFLKYYVFEILATIPLQMCSFELWSLRTQHTLLCDLRTIDLFLIVLTRKKSCSTLVYFARF